MGHAYLVAGLDQGGTALTSLTPRRFVALAGTSLAVAPLFAPRAVGQAKPKVVVIGGGPGGGTVARYVNKDSSGAAEVILIEPQKTFTTCFFSNLYVGGFRDFNSITHSYDKVEREGIKLVHEAAAAVDRDKREVVLAGGARLAYDRLVVAPGIDLKWDSVRSEERRVGKSVAVGGGRGDGTQRPGP